MYNNETGFLSNIFFNAETILLLDEYGELPLSTYNAEGYVILNFTMPTTLKAVITELQFGVKGNSQFILTGVKPELQINGISIFTAPESYSNSTTMTQTKNYNAYNEKLLFPVNRYHSEIRFILPSTAYATYLNEVYYCRIKGYYYSDKI